MRVLGIDPGTVSIDLCGIADGRVFLDAAVPTREALADPGAFVDRIAAHGPLDCIAGPSGYGLPLTRGADLTDADLRLAMLASSSERGGIGGLSAVLRALAASSLPVVFTPGVVHLPTVPSYRKINRVDMGTADKVCAAALAIQEQASRRGCPLGDTSLILLELGGAFTAAIAVAGGQIIDGIGGSSGPLGARAPGALDAEVAFLAGRISKSMIFDGGAATVRGEPLPDPEALARPTTSRGQLAWDAFVEGAVKATAALQVALPHPAEIVLSGRLARSSVVCDVMAGRLHHMAPVHCLRGFARVAKQAAQGAALVADGLAGGTHAPLVDVLALRQSGGTVLDWLYVITPEQARERLARASG
jgi:predicted butyrate kinase (DUF1464 family)